MTPQTPETAQLNRELELLHNRMCKAINDPKRLMILYALADRPRYVVDLAAELDYPQPTVSRHLNALHSTGLIGKERRGKQVYYALNDARIIDALDLMRTMLRDMTEKTARVAAQSTYNSRSGDQ